MVLERPLIVTITLQDLPPLRDVLARHQLMARKSLGQHFLCDLNLTRRIAAGAGDLTGCSVIEIGPGPGGLTRALLETKAEKVIAIEKDHRCLAALSEIHDIVGDRLTLIEGDALKIDLTTLAPPPLAIVANLPYNIGTELLIRWLKQMPAYRSMTLMFQAEVVERIAAHPDNKTFGRLSIMAQFCCDVKPQLFIPARAFTPPPKVDSAVVHLTPRLDRPTDISLASLERVTAAAFGQRRKMLRSSLKPLGGEALLLKAELAPELRAENLSLADYEKLTRCLEDKRP